MLILDLNFAYSTLGNICLYKVQTSLSISFMKSNLNKSVSISNCDVYKGIIFDGCKIQTQQIVIENNTNTEFNNHFISLKNTKINTYFCINNITCKNIIADGSIIGKDGRLCIYSSEIHQISMQRMLVYGELSILRLTFRNKNSTSLSLTYSVNLGIINIDPDNLNIIDFDTAKLLRQSAQKLSNNIEAVYLKAIEHQFFLKNKKEHFRFNTKHIAEYLLLWLNNISSQFGTNWLRAIMFCIVISALSVTIIGLIIKEYLFSLNPETCIFLTNDFWAKTFEFLWLPNLQQFEEITKHTNNNALAIIAFIAGKSLVAYGIYQTVSSFRKYNK